MMLFASIISAQCDAEFNYGGTTEFCTTGGSATVSHMTGEDGAYTYTGVGTLDINATTGEIDLAGSDAGTYDVTNTVTMSGDPVCLMISAIMDGDLSGGVPKMLELLVLCDIPDLSIYGLSNSSNGGTQSTVEYNFPSTASAVAGDYIYVTTTTSTDMMELMDYFPTTTFDPALLFEDNVANNNGDDVVELYLDGVVIDVYGVEGVNGDNETWDYTDSWAYRNLNAASCPNSSFTDAEWIFAGRGAIDGVSTNPADTEANHLPIGTFQSSGSCAGGSACTDAAMISITITEGTEANAGGNKLGCGTDPIALSATGTGMWSGGNGSFDDAASANTNYNPIASEVGTTVTLTYSVMDAVCGNSSDEISVTLFEEAEDSEFFYSTTTVCPNGDPLMAMHMTGQDGIYTFEVVSGGPNLDLNAASGAIDPTLSDVGVYSVTNTIIGSGQMVITGVADGTLFGGQPKAIEIFALTDIPDLSIYGIGVAANNNASNGENYTFPAESVSEGDYIYITANGPDFLTFYGFEANYVSGAISINGNDALELFENGVVIDAFGDVGVNPPNIAWNYQDGWALRNSNTGPDGGFSIGNWTFGGVNSLEGGTSNNTADNPFPIGTYSSFQGPICPSSETTLTVTVGDNEAPDISCPGGVFINLEPGECGEVLILPIPSAVDNCEGVTVTQTAGPSDGDFVSYTDSPITVSFDITEANGNVTVCEFDIVLTEFVPTSTSLTCNDNLNISLDANCEVLINADMILEGNNYGCYDDFTIETSFGSNLITVPGSYTVTVTDPETGNSCWSDILVEDKFNASLICSICPPGAAASGTLDCIFSCVDEDAILAGLVSVPGPDLTDNCGDANVTFSDQISDGTACGTRVITRTYAVIASDGTVVSTCVSEYLLNPITTDSPQFSFPPLAVTLPCGTGTDPEDIANFFDDKIDTDGDGFPDTPTNPTNDIATGPNCPVDVIEKNEGIAIGYVHYFETGCDGVAYAQPVNNSVCMLNVTYSDQEIPACGPGCNGNVKVIRTWTVLDWCSPSAPPVTYTQIIKSVDTDAPTIEAEGFSASVNPWNCLGDFSLPAPTLLHDLCTANLTYTVSGPAGTTLIAPNTPANQTDFWVVFGAPKTMPGQPNIFTYTASDCCGNTSSVDIEVNVYDSTPPTPIAKQNIIVNLTTSGQSDANGNASGVAKIFNTSVNNGSYDGCSDVKIEIRREESQVACGYSGNSTYATNDDFPNAGDTNPTRADYDPDNGEYVKFCCADITDVDPVTGVEFGLVPVRMRVFDDGNMNGIYGDWDDADNDGIRDLGEYDNYNETWVTVRVEGKAIASIVCPPDVTLACDMDYTDPAMIGSATSLALCGSESVDVTFNPQLDACGVGFVIATYTVIGSNPVISCNQRIDIANPYPAFDPSGISFPRDLPTNATAQISCTDEINFAPPTWTEGACDFIGYTEDVDTFFFEVDPITGVSSDACFKILRSFTVIDWCVYDATNGQEGLYYGSQTIKITDRDAPVLNNCAPAMFEVDANCVRTSTVLTNNATDAGNCASDWLKWQVFVDTWGDGVVDYEYSSFLPTNDSNITNDTNGNGINDRYVAPTMSGETVSINVLETLEASAFNHLVTWKVTDGCGNVASCETTFMVVDKKAPTPYCVSLSTALMENGSVELWAIDFDLGAFDNCTAQDDLRFTFSNTLPENDNNYDPTQNSSAMVFTDCGVQSVDVYVWDEYGNVDFCTVELTVNGENCGDVVPETCMPNEFTGWSVSTCNAESGTNGPVGVIYDIRATENAPVGSDWASSVDQIHPSNWTIDQIGQVFGIALDTDGDIYLAASDVYDTQFNSDPYGPGQIFKASAINDFLAEPFVELPNTGGAFNGIGNIAYCNDNDMLYASNLEDGKIYRINSSGNVMESFDPWSEDDNVDGIAIASEQVWAIGLNVEDGEKKLYFPRIGGGERAMYSITLNENGSFPSVGSESLEFDGIMGVGLRISDIAFNTAGTQMVFAERGSKFLTGAHDSKTIRYDLTDGSWNMELSYFVGGFVTDEYPSLVFESGQSSAGGVDFGATTVTSEEIIGEDELVWASMNYFENGLGNLFYGAQGMNVDGNNSVLSTNNPNSETDIILDYDGDYISFSQKGDIGDIEIFRCKKSTTSNRMTIAGNAVTEFGNGVMNAEVKAEALLPEYPATSMTTVEGGFAFMDNPAHRDYTISVVKDDDHTNGVSTLDLVLIQRHIVGFADLDSPYKVIAADVNADDKVSSIDIVELRKLILGVHDEFLTNTSWRFVDGTQTFADISSPFPVDETRNVNDLVSDMMHEDFVAVKVGDVNATATSNVAGLTSEVRSGATMLLEVTDRAVVAGEQVDIAVSSKNFNDVSGLQMTIEFNGLTFNSVDGKAIALGTSNVGVITDKVITMSWNSNVEVSSTDDLFVIKAIAIKDGNISEMISISDRVITPEVYVGSSLEVQNVELGIRGGSPIAIANELMQNEPNPFKQSTAISFNLANAGKASLTIRDIAGKVIRTVNGEYAAGLNTISIEKSDINTVGVLYYTIESGDFSETKKMIIIE